jgi:hypothetical protein
MDNLLVVHPDAHLDAGQANHPSAGKCVQGRLISTPSLFRWATSKTVWSFWLVLAHRPRFEQIERQLDHPKMMVPADACGHRPDASGCEFRVIRGAGKVLELMP